MFLANELGMLPSEFLTRASSWDMGMLVAHYSLLADERRAAEDGAELESIAVTSGEQIKRDMKGRG